MSKANESENPLLSYLDEMVEKLRALLPRAITDGDQTAIHHARVATRRLHAAMNVLKPISSKAHRKELSKILSKLRKNLGPARDLDVMLGHLTELKSKRLQPGVLWLTGTLKQSQQESRQIASDEIDVAKAMSRLGAWWGVRQQWLESLDRVDHLIGESLHRQLDEFIEHADAIAGHVNGRIDAQMLDPHELRIAAKALRYTLEMAVGGGHRLPARVTRSFKRMQDALGLWHDYVVLNDAALNLSLKGSLAYHDAPTLCAVLDVAKAAVLKAQQQLKKFRSLWNACGEDLAATIRGAFVMSEPQSKEIDVTEPKTDPDPVDSTPSVEPPAAPVADEPSSA